jgi:uncharacterized protein YjbJ (UPF0337 family)
LIGIASAAPAKPLHGFYIRSVAERRFLVMKSSTKDKINGTLKEATGKVKEEAGKATGNRNLRDRGTAEKVGGTVQRKIGEVKKVFGG